MCQQSSGVWCRCCDLRLSAELLSWGFINFFLVRRMGMVGFWFLFYSYCGGKNGPGFRWEQWLWDLKGTLFATNFSESMFSFLVFSSHIWLLTCFDAHHASLLVSWWILGQGLEGENYKHVQESSSGSWWWMDWAWFRHSIPVSEKVDCDRTKFTLKVLDLSSWFGCDNLDCL